MRIVLDTNILISFLISKDSFSSKLIEYLLINEEVIISDYIYKETLDVIGKKFPYKLPAFRKFFCLKSNNIPLVLKMDEYVKRFNIQI